MKKFILEFSDDLHKEIKTLSVYLEIPMQKFIRSAIQFYLDALKERNTLSEKEPENTKNTPKNEPNGTDKQTTVQP